MQRKEPPPDHSARLVASAAPAASFSPRLRFLATSSLRACDLKTFHINRITSTAMAIQHHCPTSRHVPARRCSWPIALHLPQGWSECGQNTRWSLECAPSYYNRSEVWCTTPRGSRKCLHEGAYEDDGLLCCVLLLMQAYTRLS